MNNRKWQTVLWVAISAVALAWAPAALAGSNQFRVEVPFAFQAGGTTYDAGMYNVSYEMGTKLVQLRPDAGGPAAFVPGRSAYRVEEPARGTVVFQKVGGKWAMKEVWAAGMNFGAEMRLPKAPADTAQWKTLDGEIAVLYAKR